MTLHALTTPPAAFDWSAQRVLLIGGSGFVGQGIQRALARRGIGAERVLIPRREEFDLTTDHGAWALFASVAQDAPTLVIHCAGRVGSILNSQQQPADFFHQNLTVCINAIEHAVRSGLARRGGKFVLVGTASAYPKAAPIPFNERDLFAGFPEPANAPYGLAKRAAGAALAMYHQQHGLRSAYLVPMGMYGPHDHFEPDRAHVVAALIRRCVEAAAARTPSITCWGSGAATRDLLFVDDAAEAICRAAERISDPEPINLGSGREISIRNLTETIASLTGYGGRIEWDSTKPDGAPRRLMDVSRAAALLGWQAAKPLEAGLRATIDWYKSAGLS